MAAFLAATRLPIGTRSTQGRLHEPSFANSRLADPLPSTGSSQSIWGAGWDEGGKDVATHQNIAEWFGKTLVDPDGEKIGKLEDVYVDVETDEPMFGTVKEGLIGRHLTFVPLGGIEIGPDNLRVRASKEKVKEAPNIELRGEELYQDDEKALYHYYELNYTPPATESGRRLARR